jgi:periodic tryptophan protein 1
MITALSWVPRGAARSHPVRFELSAEEVARVQELAAEEEAIEEAESAAEHTRAAFDSDEEENGEDGEEVDLSDLPAALDMEHYDDDEQVLGMAAVMGGNSMEEGDVFNVLLQGDSALAMDAGSDDDDEDDEDDEILPTDALLVVALTEDDFSHLEVCLYTIFHVHKILTHILDMHII